MAATTLATPQTERPAQAEPVSADARAPGTNAHPQSTSPPRPALLRPQEARPTAGEAERKLQGAREMNGHVRLLAAPGYGQLLAREPILRRAIPFLTIIFILVIGAYRIAITVDQRAETLEVAQSEITLLATALSADAARLTATSNASLSAIVGERLPGGATRDGRQIALVEDNAIAATFPFRGDLIGRPPGAILGENQPLTTFGKRAGVMEVHVDGLARFATVHHIENT
ncbi:MAG: hypothetical protein AAFW98_15100, partial [Pseudomonadota bacterium]